MPSCNYDNITTLTKQIFQCLTKICAMEVWEPSEKLLMVIQNFPQDIIALTEHITDCSLHCNIHKEKVRQSVKDLKKRLSACLEIQKSIAENMELQDFPPIVRDFLKLVEKEFSHLTKQLDRKIKSEKWRSAGNPNFNFNNSSEITVNYGCESRGNPAVPDPEVPPAAAKADPQAAASHAPEAKFPETTPAGGVSPESDPAPEERLPEHLEKIKSQSGG